MNAGRVLVGSSIGTVVVWGVATVDPYLALGAGTVAAGAAVGVQRALGSPVAAESRGGPDGVEGPGRADGGDPGRESGGEAGSGGVGTNSEIGVEYVDFDGAVAALATVLVVLGGSLLSGTVPGRTGAAVADALVVLGVFGYSLFGLFVPGFGLVGLGGAVLSRRIARWVAG